MKKTVSEKTLFFVLIFISSLFVISCGGGGSGSGAEGGEGGNSVAVTKSEYVVFSWNDLGMHCLNPTYDVLTILPPYNNLIAQVVKRGDPPAIVTSGITVEYRIINNTYSYGKTDSLGAVFAEFWDNALTLFGVNLPVDKGLNLVDPNRNNGLSGTMTVGTDHFEAIGIPLTPVDDNGVWNPYQVAEITVKDIQGTVLAKTRTTAPTSDEISCNGCHNANDPFNDILAAHDRLHGTNLTSQKPVLCANCHGSPALGQSGPGSSGLYLSYAVHNSHSTRGAACYDCHPGNTTKCSRSIAHTASDGNCVTCHGTMSQVASSISSGARIPWLNEPKCFTCHNVSGVDTGATLYRNARGHGNIFCASCHGSPHAMVPTNQDADNYQAVQYQGRAKTIGSCGACHSGSRGEGSSEFGETHGGANPERYSACNICHTSVSTDTSRWPHAFQWKNR